MNKFVRSFVAAAALAACLPGAASAGGSGVLDEKEMTEGERADTLAWCRASIRKADPAKLPAAVRRAADEVVPGFRVRGATEIRGWSPFAWRDHGTLRLKGRDADGREVSVSVRDDGSRPAVFRTVPLGRVPEADLAEARKYAAGHGYTLTRAEHVVRTVRVLGMNVGHEYRYLWGSRPDRPGVERLVWLSGEGRFGLRDLEDLWWIKLTD
jgi:hypothetical protein